MVDWTRKATSGLRWALATTALAGAGGALAQTAAPSAHTDDAAEQEIVVTGSRIQSFGFQAPTPTKALTVEAIEARSLATIGEFLNEIPSFRNTTGSTTATSTTLGAGQNYADLRGLGSIRTLTLVDGRRHVPSSAFGQVDLNLVPTILVERIDVVTGGASAAYGSDAVSGVVNIILNKRLNGFKGDISYGLSQHNDFREKRAALAWGTSFNDDRGHFVIGGEYVDNSGIRFLFDRDWGREQHGLVSYVGARPADAPSRLYARGVAFVNMAYGGLISSVTVANPTPANQTAANLAFRGIQFGAGGVRQPFSYGNAATFGAAPTSISGATSTLATDFTGGNLGLFPQDRFPIAVPLNRKVALAHFDYDLSDALSMFVDAGFGRTGTRNQSPPVRDTATTGATAVTIRRDNAFLPAAIATLMDQNAVTSFTLGRENDDFGKVATNNRNTTVRVVAGFDADLGDSWKLDGYFTYGRNKFDGRVERLRIERNYFAAVDSILVGGVPTCRNLATNPGCVPINLFGFGSPSQPAINYVTGTVEYEIVTKQKVGSLTLQGEPFSTWAGPVAIALGGEVRREAASALSDPISQASGFNYSNPKAFRGGYTVKEVFGEVIVPLAKDMRFAELLELNAAGRYTHYSTSGGVETWKLGATYAPIPDIRFRVTRSRDIRAPTNSELFAVTSTLTQLRNPFSGVTSQILTLNQSSPTLRPEKADTWTVGAVLTPSFLPGLSLSVDYYDINIKGAISSYTAQTVLDNCLNEVNSNATPFFCNFVSRSGAGAGTLVNQVAVQLLNIASLRTKGFDFEASYRFKLGSDTVTARAFATYTKDLVFNDGTGIPRTFNAAGVLQNQGSVIDRAGSVGGFTAGQNTSATNSPHWIANASILYQTGPLQGSLQGRYVGGGRFDNSLVGPGDPNYNPASPISIADNRVQDRFYLDASLAYDIIADGRRKLQVYGVASNITNVDPPFPVIAIAGIYDRIGRNFKAGVRFNF